jgi:O-antigen/teichoic acid export membrane protein
MALADIKDAKHAPAPHLWLRLRRRVAEWLDGEHALTQRMAGSAFAIRVASAGIMFLSQILLARWMGGSEFGVYVYVWTWLMLLGDLVHLGVPLTAQRFVPEYTQAKSFDLLRGYFGGSLWITFTMGTVAAIIGALIVRAIENSIDSHLILPFYFACAALPFYAVTFMMDGLARSYNWINLALLSPYIVRPIMVIAAVGVLRLSGVALDAATVMGTLAAATWLTVLIQLLQLNRGLKAAVAPGRKAYDLRLWLGTSLPIVLVWGMYTLLTSTDVLVLKQFRPAEDVAHYYAAAKTLALMSIIQFAVAAAAAHRFTTYHVDGDREGLAAFAAETVRWVFWPSLAASLLVIALGRPLLMLFGPDFVAGYPVMAILAIGQLARASIGPAERLLNMLGQQRICAVAYAAAFTFNIVTCVLLAPTYGGVGAACATAGAFVVESLLLFVIARRKLGLHMFIWRPRGHN